MKTLWSIILSPITLLMMILNFSIDLVSMIWRIALLAALLYVLDMYAFEGRYAAIVGGWIISHLEFLGNVK